MNTTNHYQLNQWDPGDRILRTNFNSDNEKIDTAIKTVETATAAETVAREAAVDAAKAEAIALVEAGPMRNIRSVVTTSAAVSINLDLSDIVWDDWRYIYVALILINPTGIAAALTTNLTIEPIGYVHTDPYPSLELRRHYGWLKFFVMNESQSAGALFLLEGNGTAGFHSLGSRYKDIHTLKMTTTNNTPILSGSSLRIWGEH